MSSAVPPVKVAPPSVETLDRILLLHAPAVFTPLYSGLDVTGLKPRGVHPFDGFESRLMYEPIVTTTCLAFVGLTPPTGRFVARNTESMFKPFSGTHWLPAS